MEAHHTAAALDALFQPFNRSDAPGLVVGVAQHGRTVYRRGFGLANIEHGVANTPSTRMRIGSTSKHFTCLAALLLAEDGLLEIDAGVRRYLPELPMKQGEPTLRQLMTHTGGYRCNLETGVLANGLALRPRGQGLAMQCLQSDVNFAPGDNIIYCNGGYHLLSLIIAKVSGMPFEAFLKARIFEPLAMRDSESVPSDLAIRPRLAGLYLPASPQEGGGWRRGIFPTEEILGEGGIVSTVDDMLRWLAHLRAAHKTVGSADSWAQMLRRVRLNNGQLNPYALGLMRDDYRGVEVIQHSGGLVGGSCQMLTVPDHGLDIILMVNGAPASPKVLAKRIIDLMLGEALLAAPAALARSEGFGPVLGRRYYAPQTGYLLGFADQGGQLAVSVLNNPPRPIRDEGDTLRLGFEDMACGALEIPAAALAGAPPALRILEAGSAYRFELLPAAAPPLAEAGRALLGRYRSADLNAEAEIRFDGQRLCMRVFGDYGISELSLQAFSADVFGWQLVAGELSMGAVLNTERRADGRVSGLRLNTPRSRQVRFERIGD